MNPTRSEIIAVIRAERRMLADVVDGLTLEQWHSRSACRGWTVGEVVNHIMAYDRFPWRALAAVLRVQSPLTWVADWQRRQAELGPAQAARALRTNPLPFTLRWLGRPGAYLNVTEEVVHVEDVLRPLGIAREHEPPEEVLWPALKLFARYQFRKLGTAGRLRFEAPSGRAFTLSSRLIWPKASEDGENWDARVMGPPLELMLFVTGRQSGVTVRGEGPMAGAARKTRLSL